MSYLSLDSIKIFLALSISIDVVSGYTDTNIKEYREKNWSGIYHMVEIVNDRPAYKVSFCYLQETLAIKSMLLLNFSEPKKMKMVLKYISGIMGHTRIGFWVSKLDAGFTSVLKASTISEHIYNESLYF